MINKEPIYQQLNRALRQLISSDKYQKNDKFITERMICEIYEVSRATANKSLSSLVSEGLLSFKKGVGTFVRSKPAGGRLFALTSFTENTKSAGKTPGSKILRFERLTAGGLDSVVAEKLEVGRNDEVYLIERLRAADGVPMILEQRFIVAKYCPDLFEKHLKGSLHEIFTKNYNLDVYGTDETIQAVVLSDEEASLLLVNPGRAGFLVTTIGYIGDRTPLWWDKSLYKPDAFEYRCQICPNDSVQILESHVKFE